MRDVGCALDPGKFRVPADRSRPRAWRIEKDARSRRIGTEIAHVFVDDAGLKTRALKIASHTADALFVSLDRNDIGAARRELKRLAARRSTEIEDRLAADIAEQARG